jgi:elongation factor Ts
MGQITAADVKKLRGMTGAGMMDCKKALSESDGNIDAAVDLLRKKGLSAAARKAGRVAAEGIVTAVAKGNTGVVVEVNSETDFVSKNEQFRNFIKELCELILREEPADIKVLNSLDFGDGHTVEQALSQLISTIGENMNIRRFEHVQIEHGIVSAYVHGEGKIGVLVGLKGEPDDTLSELARSIAMHVAAVNPQYIRREEVSADVVERERKVLSERAAASGKPEQIIEKIVSGQLNKFYSDICLLEQDFVINTDQTVAQAVAAVQVDADVMFMSRFQLGEGIEKEESDFAAEVAAQING